MASPKKRLSSQTIGRLYRIRASVPGQSKKKSKRPKPVARKQRSFKPVPSTRSLLAQTWRFCWHNRRKLGGVVIVYGILYLVLVSGLGDRSQVASTQESLRKFLGNNPLSNTLLTTGLVIFGAGAPSSSATGQPNVTGQMFQFLLPLLGSIAFIWTIRQVHAGRNFRIREAFYWSMQPLIPLVLVLVSMAIRLLPLIIGGYILAVVRANGFATNGVEAWAFGGLWLGLVLWSFLLLVPPILAIYAVTLPEVYPRQALKAARVMIRGQRLKVLGRLLAGLGLGLVVFFLLVYMSIYWLPSLVVPLSLVLGFIGLMMIHAYFYNVYRSLL